MQYGAILHAPVVSLRLAGAVVGFPLDSFRHRILRTPLAKLGLTVAHPGVWLGARCRGFLSRSVGSAPRTQVVAFGRWHSSLAPGVVGYVRLDGSVCLKALKVSADRVTAGGGVVGLAGRLSDAFNRFARPN